MSLVRNEAEEGEFSHVFPSSALEPVEDDASLSDKGQASDVLNTHGIDGHAFKYKCVALIMEGERVRLAPEVAPSTGEYTIARGALPDGLRVDQASGEINGYTYDIGLFDAEVRCDCGAMAITSNRIRFKVVSSIPTPGSSLNDVSPEHLTANQEDVSDETAGSQSEQVTSEQEELASAVEPMASQTLSGLNAAIDSCKRDLDRMEERLQSNDLRLAQQSKETLATEAQLQKKLEDLEQEVSKSKVMLKDLQEMLVAQRWQFATIIMVLIVIMIGMIWFQAPAAVAKEHKFGASLLMQEAPEMLTDGKVEAATMAPIAVATMASLPEEARTDSEMAPTWKGLIFAVPKHVMKS